MIALGSFCLCCHASLAQTNEHEAVKAVVNKMFAGMKAADSATISSCFAPGAHMETIARTRSGADTVRGNTVAQFAGAVAKAPPGSLDERISFGSVLVDANMAQVWTPYAFYRDGQFSHCGVNSFQLVKLSGEWKIVYIIDTRRKEACR